MGTQRTKLAVDFQARPTRLRSLAQDAREVRGDDEEGGVNPLKAIVWAIAIFWFVCALIYWGVFIP
jgi:hypothetical protein